VTTRIPVPGWLGERAAKVTSGQRPAAEPRDAATVVLLRPGADGASGAAAGGFEVLLLGRARAMDFAPGAHVFPGGSVDPADSDADIDRPDDVFDVLGVPPERGRGLIGAAIRETFEECGVRLLAGALIPWTRWITPEASDRRYDTWFFVAQMPAGQVAILGSSGRAESDTADWLRPDAALEAARAGEITLLPPTAVTLAELAACGTVEEAMRQRRTLTPVMPAVVVEDGEAWLALPDEVDYPL
jgi:8-oxo-dGTP pyrophosphatase MutT (NUDIX family)